MNCATYPAETAASEIYNALLDLGFLNETAAQRAWKAHERTGTAFHVVLTELGILKPERLRAFWAQWLSLDELVDDAGGDPDLAQRLSMPFLQNSLVAPLKSEGDVVRIAISYPLDRTTLESIGYILDKDVKPVCGTPRQILSLLEQLAPAQHAVQDHGEHRFSGTGGGFLSDVEHLTALANDGPVVQQVNALFADAYDRRASDIHLEPRAGGLIARFRIDGQLVDAKFFDPAIQTAVISRLKIMAMMDITERRLPQDGRSSVMAAGKKIDLRMSTLPTIDGESVVVRLLVQDASKLTWDMLGFAAETQKLLDEIIRRPVGLFLVTGPTGSGKTTTLYTALGKIDRTEKKVISVEDPVEYRLNGVVQVQVHQELGLDFANVLRTTMRHNPNTIMIGEIRDSETAQIAMRAAMTGHQVFSTLHTDGAISSINRLADMGVPRYLLGAHINAIMSQRLVRRLCPCCSTPASDLFHPTSRSGSEVIFEPVNHRLARGCRECGDTGYQGRTIISELLILSQRLKQSIAEGKSWHDIRDIARAEGFKTQFEHGLCLVSEGTTSVDELLAHIEQA